MSFRGSHAGSRAIANKVSGDHATCIVTTSDSGRIKAPLVIVQGFKVMKKWFDPLNLPVPDISDHSGIRKYYKKGWCRREFGVAVSKNGSIAKAILADYIRKISIAIFAKSLTVAHMLFSYSMAMSPVKVWSGLSWVSNSRSVFRRLLPMLPITCMQLIRISTEPNRSLPMLCSSSYSKLFKGN